MVLMFIVARVKKILNIDDEIMACSNNGAFAITIATARFTNLFLRIEQSLTALGNVHTLSCGASNGNGEDREKA